MDVALFMYMFYARHAKKTSGADTHTLLHAGKTCMLMLHKHTNAHKDYCLSTVTHLKDS